MASVWLIYLSLLFSLFLPSIDGRNIPLTDEEDLELERELQSLNKPPVKTIKQSFSGDLFDCIKMYKQPAFDHPALKNHKLQIRPSFHTNNVTMEEKSKSLLDSGFNDTCPPGTVLIRRTQKEDLIISKELPKYFRNYGSKYHVLDSSGKNYYTIVQSRKASLHGFQSKITAWALPNVLPNQGSANQVWLLGDIDGPDGSLNAVQAGWHVLPNLYNDTVTRFFTYWTINDYQTGCMNLNCKGFVQVSANRAPGFALPNLSVYGGKQEYLDLLIEKDPASGHWWVAIEGMNVGYWPNELFPNLRISTEIDFGGAVYTLNNQGSPPMGSGHLPDEGIGKASYFMQVLFKDSDEIFFTPGPGYVVPADNVDARYYEVFGDPPKKGDYDVSYGGPGGLQVG